MDGNRPGTRHTIPGSNQQLNNMQKKKKHSKYTLNHPHVPPISIIPQYAAPINCWLQPCHPSSLILDTKQVLESKISNSKPICWLKELSLSRLSVGHKLRVGLGKLLQRHVEGTRMLDTKNVGGERACKVWQSSSRGHEGMQSMGEFGERKVC